MEKKRFWNIDFLKTIATIGVIATHTLSFHLTNQVNYFIWNYLQFVVVIFVFCSGYVLTFRYQNRFDDWLKIIPWYGKRILRLLTPFYSYIFIHYLLWLLFPNCFSGLGLKKDFGFITQSIFLTGGVSLGWLTLLFIELTLLFPLLIKGLLKKNLLFVYIFISVLTTSFFTFKTFSYAFYRPVMWIPWSLILILSIYVFIKEQNDINVNYSIRRYLFFGLISGFIFSILFIIWNIKQRSFQFFDNKYPLNFYYLSYTFALSCLIFIISKHQIWEEKIIGSLCSFISENSYQLFFIHYVVLDFSLKLSKHSIFLSNVFVQFTLVTVISLIFSFILKNLKINVTKTALSVLNSFNKQY